MLGIVKTYLPERGYGFIKGDDGKYYYFVLKDKAHMLLYAEGVTVMFEPESTPKGFFAHNCQLLPDEATSSYVAPNEVMVTTHSSIAGWEMLELSEWTVEALGSGDPEVVKQQLRIYAKRLGANAVVDLKYSTKTGYVDNHQYTSHVFRGTLAVIGKKALNGIPLNQLVGVNKKAAAMKQAALEQEKLAEEKQYRVTRLPLTINLLTVLLAVIAGQWFNAKFVSTLTIMGAVILIYVLLNKRDVPHDNSWLIKKH